MYAIVKLIAEDVTALVPVNWITAPNKCLWPDFKDTARITKAAKNQAEPETTWREYECSELYRSEDYEKTRKWLKLSEHTSVLGTASSCNEEEADAVRRSKRKRQIHCDSSSDEDVTLTLKNRYQKKSNSQEIMSSLADIRPPMAPCRPSRIQDFRPSSPLEAPCSSSQIPDFRPSSPLEAPCRPSRNADFRPSTPLEARCRHSPISGRACFCGGVNGRQFEEAMRRLFYTLETLKEDINVLKRRIVRDEDSTDSKLPEGIVLPIDSVVTLKKVETEIDSEDNFKLMVGHLGLIGGDSIKSCVFNTMRRLFTTNLAATMCWSGSKDKREFQALKLKNVLFNAVRNFKNATEEDIRKAIRR